MKKKYSTKKQIIRYIEHKYNIRPQIFMTGTDQMLVFRHVQSKIWFAALIEDVCERKLGLSSDTSADLLNLKIPSIAAAETDKPAGCISAYHMNKENWISLFLDETISTAQLCSLIDISYRITAKEIEEEKIQA